MNIGKKHLKKILMSVGLIKVLLVFGLFLIPFVTAQISEYPQITEQYCDAVIPCPAGLECFSFPSIGLRCAQPEPCSYYKCPSNTQCVILEIYPGIVHCSPIDTECGEDCEKTVTCQIGCECDSSGKIIACKTEPYVPPTSICPVNCECDSQGKVISCKTEPYVPPTSICPVNCECDSQGRIVYCGEPKPIPLPTPPDCPISCICKGDTITCPVEEETTTGEKSVSKTVSGSGELAPEKICPLGCVCKKDQITCASSQTSKQEGCLMGCKLNDKCVVQGTRVIINEDPSYCDIDSKWQKQKEENEECQNNYECKTNFCSNDRCYDISKEVKETKNIVQKIVDWLKNLFGFK